MCDGKVRNTVRVIERTLALSTVGSHYHPYAGKHRKPLSPLSIHPWKDVVEQPRSQGPSVAATAMKEMIKQGDQRKPRRGEMPWPLFTNAV